MPEEKVSMRKVKEILRLRFGLGLQQNQIARSCSIGQATVHRYLRKAAAAGLTWPLPDDLDDRRLEELLFPAAVGRPLLDHPVACREQVVDSPRARAEMQGLDAELGERSRRRARSVRCCRG